MKYSQLETKDTVNVVEIILISEDGTRKVCQTNHYGHMAWEAIFGKRRRGYFDAWRGQAVATFTADTDIRYANSSDILHSDVWVSSETDFSSLTFINRDLPIPNIKLLPTSDMVTVDLNYMYGGNSYIKNTRTYAAPHGTVDMTINCLGLTYEGHYDSYITLDTPIDVTPEDRLIVVYSTLFRDPAITVSGDTVVIDPVLNKVKTGEGSFIFGEDSTTYEYEVFNTKFQQEGTRLCLMCSHIADRTHNGEFTGKINKTVGTENLTGDLVTHPVVESVNRRTYSFRSTYTILPTFPPIVNAVSFDLDIPFSDAKFQVVLDKPLTTVGDVQITFNLGFDMIANQEV